MLTTPENRLLIISYLKKNTPHGFGYCSLDFEHQAELFIQMHSEIDLFINP